MIRLPEGLERGFLEAVYELEEAKKMPYVTSAERFGIEKGVKIGVQQGVQQGEAAVLLRQIERKFGQAALAASRERVQQADAETLLAWSERILTAKTIEDVFR